MAKTDKTEQIKARCLQKFTHDGKDYAVDDIFTGLQAEIIALTANGLIDSHKDAVSYIEGRK